MVTMEQAREAKTIAQDLLKDIPGVAGIGIGWCAGGEPCVQVNAEPAQAETIADRLPVTVDGVKIRVEKTSGIRFLKLSRVKAAVDHTDCSLAGVCREAPDAT